MAGGNDKLQNLAPTSVSFVPGERPTDIKLTGMMTEIYDSLDYLEYSLGDLYGYSALISVGDVGLPLGWFNNLARDMGDRDYISPHYLPGVNVPLYVQTLGSNVTSQELDLIPVALSGSALLNASTEPALVPSQFKTTPAGMSAYGDWTIAIGLNENGDQKWSRNLVTFAPTSGGTITFNSVTSGHGDSYYGSTPNVSPSEAQAGAGGPFCAVVVIDPVNNIYKITLPVYANTYDRFNNTVAATLSNTVPGLETGQQMVLPSYLFNPSGLNLLANDPITGSGQIYPLGSLRVYDWGARRVVDGLLQIQASAITDNREFEVLVTFSAGTVLTPSLSGGQYLVVASGTSIYDYLGRLSAEFYNHTHQSDDLVRQLSHSTLMGLRTSDPTSVSTWYGASNIPANDHTHYLHRDGLDLSDIGGGYNMMRGSVLIGSTSSTPQVGTTAPNYNIASSSYGLYFGTTAGPSMNFVLAETHDIANGYANIPANFSAQALVINGATSTGPIQTTLVNGVFRANSDVVLGTSTSNEVAVSGTLYVQVNLGLKELASAPAAVANHGQIYTETDHHVYYENNSGTIIPLSRGQVPLGAVIPIMSQLTGSYSVPSTGTVSHEGWMLADGSAIPGGNAVSGSTPNLTSAIFIMGSTTGGTTGGSNTTGHTHTVTPTTSSTGTAPAHYHGLGGLSINGAGTGISASGSLLKNTGDTGSDGRIVCGGQYDNVGTVGVTVSISDPGHGHGVSGYVGNGGGPDGDAALTLSISTTNPTVTSSAPSISESRPNYMSAVYMIRVN